VTSCWYCGNENYSDRIEFASSEEFCCQGCMEAYLDEHVKLKTKCRVIRGIIK